MVPFCVLEPQFRKAAHNPKMPKNERLTFIGEQNEERQAEARRYVARETGQEDGATLNNRKGRSMLRGQRSSSG
jgi:hypothetical protein